LKELLSGSEFGILGWAGFLGEVILPGIKIWRIFEMSRILEIIFVDDLSTSTIT